MTLKIELTPEEERLVQTARANGVDVTAFLKRSLADLPTVSATDGAGKRKDARSATTSLIQSWIDEGDADEQTETFEALREGLNQNHSSSRAVLP